MNRAHERGVSPESLLYLARSYSGGPGELTRQAGDISQAVTSGSSLEARDVPILSRFVRYVRNDARSVDARAKHVVDEERQRSVTERLELQAEALAWIERGKAADDAGKQNLLAELRGNPRLKAAVAAAAERESVKLTSTERDLAGLPVADGSRARAVVRLLRAMPEDERLLALQRMRDRGIVSKEVLKQIAAIPNDSGN